MELATGIIAGVLITGVAIYASKKYDIPTSIDKIKPFEDKVIPHGMAQVIKRITPEQELDEILKHE